MTEAESSSVASAAAESTPTSDNYTLAVTAVREVESEDDEHAATIRRLLRTPDFDVNEQNDIGNTVLHQALCERAKSHIGFKLVLNDPTFDVNLENRRGDALLRQATCDVTSEEDVKAKVVRLCLGHPRIDVNIQKPNGRSALHEVCGEHMTSHYGGHLLIEDLRCDVNLQCNSGDTALMEALEFVQHLGDNFASLIKLMLNRPEIQINCVNRRQESPLLVCLKHSRERPEFGAGKEVLEIIRLLLSHGADPNVPAHLLAYAVKYCSLDVCRELLTNGANPNSAFPVTRCTDNCQIDPETAIHSALRRNSAAKTALLLQHNVNLDVMFQGMTVVQFADVYGRSQRIMDALTKSWSSSRGSQLVDQRADDTQPVQPCDDDNQPVKPRAGDNQPVELHDGDHQAVELHAREIQSVKPASKIDHRCDTNVFDGHRDNIVDGQRLWRKKFSTKISYDSAAVDQSEKESSLDTVTRCRADMLAHQREVSYIQFKLEYLLELISVNLPEELSHFRFTPILSGSMGEDTKCYQPDEVDFICELHMDGTYLYGPNRANKAIEEHLFSGNKLNVVNIASIFYTAVSASLSGLQESGILKSDFPAFRPVFLFGDKISKLKVDYNGEFFKQLTIYVDLVPAVDVDYTHHPSLSTNLSTVYVPLGIDCIELYHIAKASRFDPPGDTSHLTISYCQAEHAVLEELPLSVKQGLILAKAARIASIARPLEHDLTSHYHLQEDIHVDDFITSYILKTCLMKMLPRHDRVEQSSCDHADVREDYNDVEVKHESGYDDVDIREKSSCGDVDVRGESSCEDVDASEESSCDDVECNCDDVDVREHEATDKCDWQVLDQCDTASGWAIRIYEKLQESLKAKQIVSWYSRITYIVDCSECKVERGCCKQRELMLAMTEQILDFLKRHRQHLDVITLTDDEDAVTYINNTAEEQVYPCGRYAVYSRTEMKRQSSM